MATIHILQSTRGRCRGAEPAAVPTGEDNAEVAPEHLPCQPQRAAAVKFKAPRALSRWSCLTRHLDLPKIAQVMRQQLFRALKITTWGKRENRRQAEVTSGPILSPAHPKLKSLGFIAKQEQVLVQAPPKLKEREQRKGTLGLWLRKKGFSVFKTHLSSFPLRKQLFMGQVHNHRLCLLQFLLPLHSPYLQTVTGFFVSKMQCKTIKYPAVIPLHIISPCDVYEICKIRASAYLYPVIFSNILFSTSSASQSPYLPYILF